MYVTFKSFVFSEHGNQTPIKTGGPSEFTIFSIFSGSPKNVITADNKKQSKKHDTHIPKIKEMITNL